MKILKDYAIFITIIALGLLTLWVAERYFSEDWTNTFLMQLASILIIGGGLGVIEKAFTRRDIIANIKSVAKENKEIFEHTRELFKIRKSISSSGLCGYNFDAKQFNFSPFLRENNQVDIVLNDGRTWINLWITDFHYRFTQQNYSTTFYLIDPEGKYASCLAEKTGYPLDEQKNKIEQAKRRLIQEFNDAGKIGILKIYLMRHFPSYALFFGESSAIMTLYSNSSGRSTVPLFLFKPDFREDNLCVSLFRQNIKTLNETSQCVFDSTALLPSKWKKFW